MKTAADILTAPVIVSPLTPVRELADTLTAQHADGACVTEGGRLVGVVTLMDLVYKETTLHMPTAFILLDAIIPLPGERARTERELHKIAASKVVDLMTVNPVTVLPTATLEHCANRMVKEHLSLLPVVDADGTLHGVVTKESLIRGAHLTS